MINKLLFVVLLVASLVLGVILMVMYDSLPFFSLYIIGFMAAIPVFVVATLGLMRGRLKQLIIFCIIGGVLVIGYTFYLHGVYIIPQREPGVLWHIGMVSYAIMGLLFGSGLLEHGTYRRMAFVAAGLLFLNHLFDSNLLFLFIIPPLLCLTFLLIELLLKKPIENEGYQIRLSKPAHIIGDSNRQSSKKAKAYTKLLIALVFILVSLVLFVLNYFMSGGQLREALKGFFFWTWVFSTSVFVYYISNALNKGAVINKLWFIALLAISLIIGVILVLMYESLSYFSFYAIGILADIPIFVVAVLGLMRERIKQLIIFGIIGGVLVTGYNYYYHIVYAIPHRDPGVLWHTGMVGYAIMGLLFGSGILETSRFGRIAFVALGLLFLTYFYFNFLFLFFVVPLLCLTFLLIRLLFRKRIKGRVLPDNGR